VEEFLEHFPAESVDHSYDDVYQLARKPATSLLFIERQFSIFFLSHRTLHYAFAVII
jgi:hypothetical protein